MDSVEAATNPWRGVQDLVKVYIPAIGTNELVQYSSTGLATESAEVLDIYKKAIGGVLPVERARVVEELGDVFYAAAMLMLMENITLDEVVEGLASKLHEIYPRGYWSLGQYQAYRRAKHGGQLR